MTSTLALKNLRFVVILFVLMALVDNISGGNLIANSTDDLLARNKRTLIYSVNGGSVKVMMMMMMKTATQFPKHTLLCDVK